jgi:response regulator NasT
VFLAARRQDRASTQIESIGHSYRIDPDVILIDLENPSRAVLEQMFQLSRVVRRPIAMFVDQSDRETTKAAVQAGVSAYIVDGLKQGRVEDILELCISRFNAVARLHLRHR